MKKYTLSFGLSFLVVFSLSGCSKEDIYNFIQPGSFANYHRECSEVPRSQQAECNERAMDYDEYETARKQTLDN